MRPLVLPAFARRLLLVVFASLFGFTFASAAPVAFNIPAQAASDALNAFSKQSGIDVLFPSKELKKVQSQTVVGKFEPDEAITMLLKDTGYAAARDGRKFVVKSTEPAVTTGSVRGSLTGEGGKGVANVLVTIKETADSTETDRYGVFAFPKVAAGTYVLVASAQGYQTMHITDVQVRAGRELTLGKEEMQKAKEGPLALEPFVVHADTVEQLEKIEVTGTKQKPFADRNVDLPRDINDAQAYYIFDAKTIDQSGATNVEAFLKQRLTMNTTVQTNSQLYTGGIRGNLSSINLRGLGANETLVLVNGRRLAGVKVSLTGLAADYGQPDINGLPLSAIDRIEVLPSSASGIYGGSALGGVINIVLKQNYTGGEVKATYDSTWDGHAPIRTVSANVGHAFENGRTHLMITAQYSDSKPLYFGDRLAVFNQGFGAISQNSPKFFFNGLPSNPYLGSSINIGSNASSSVNGVTVFQNLTLKSTGASLNSPIATVPVGYVFTNATDLGNAVLPGQWNLTNPNTNEAPNGLRTPLGTFPKNKSVLARFDRKMTERIEVFSEFSYLENNTNATYSTFKGGVSIPSSDPRNPFNQNIAITFPLDVNTPTTTNSTSKSLLVGVKVKLPGDWTGEFDYQWSQNSFKYFFTQTLSDFGLALNKNSTSLYNSALNPFDQTPQNLVYLAQQAVENYAISATGANASNLDDFALRAAGPLFHLPNGAPTLAVALEHQIAGAPGSMSDTIEPDFALQGIPQYINLTSFTYPQSQTLDSGYAEINIPVVAPKNVIPLVNAVDLQVSGRLDREKVGSGTYGYSFYPAASPNLFKYTGPTANGSPFFGTTRYSSSNYTLGLRYKPTRDVILRVSYATAFLPPRNDQLVINPVINGASSGAQTTIVDPKLSNASYKVDTLGGGNPNLKPQTSSNWAAGLIWEPQKGLFKDLRVDLEFSKVTQINAITTPGSTLILNNENIFPERVTRDPATGKVTLLDLSALNLYKLESDYWDLTVSYRKNTPFGTLDLYAVGTVNEHVKQQVSLTSPLIDLVGFPSRGGVAKTKANVTAAWTWHHWSASWTSLYYGGYTQLGAANDPVGITATYITAQGSDHIPSQIYHDVFVSYTFANASAPAETRLRQWRRRILADTTIQLGVKNVFNRLPAFDAFYSPFFASPYGDLRLRSVWLSVKKAF